MDTFLSLDYNTKHDLISNIVKIHEESIVEASTLGIDIVLPFIGRLTIKEGKLIYENVLKDFLRDNDLFVHELTDEHRTALIGIMKEKMMERKINNKAIPTETRVLSFDMKVINK